MVIEKKIFIRHFRNFSGAVLRQGTIPKSKLLNEKICAFTSCNCIPNWYLFAATKANKITRMASILGESPASEFEIPTSKIYILQQHPLRPNTIFIGTGNGLFAVRMDAGRSPPGVAGHLRPNLALSNQVR